MMWCNDCRKLVPVKYKKIVQIHSELPDNYPEIGYLAVCDECGSEDIERPSICVCGEPCEPNTDFCDDCLEDMDSAMSMAKDYFISRHPQYSNMSDEVIYGILCDRINERYDLW